MKTAKGTVGRVHVIRLEPGEDVIKGIQNYCDDNSIASGVIISGIGSLDGCSFLDPIELPGKPGCFGYGDPIDKETPIELVGLSGIICHDDGGRPSPHIHASFADAAGNEYGGHLKEGNRVLITVEIVIAEIDGMDMKRAVDPSKGVPVLFPKEK